MCHSLFCFLSPEGPVLRPYIKLHLYPFKAAKKKTQPIEAGTDLNPSFNANFKFRVILVPQRFQPHVKN